MKRIILTVLFVFTIAAVAAAEDNYLLLRYENGWSRNNNDFSGTYSVFENNTLKSWALGSKIITGEKGFKILNPYMFYKLPYQTQIGLKYSTDSFDNEAWSPAARFKGLLFNNKVFAIADFSYYIDLGGDKNRPDFWLNVVQTGKGWYYGAELWTYKVGDRDLTTHFRPIKVGYRFENDLAPYLMGEVKWYGSEKTSESVYVGLEICF